ncbi:MAG: PqqD family protein [Clostridia bacterium]|nr:PqqD family protein [Clostridia bacterium]
MKLNKDFILHIADGETLLVPTGNAKFSGIVRGNKTLGAVLEQLRNETTEEEIVAALKARFDASEEVIARDVKKAIETLNRIGAIDG